MNPFKAIFFTAFLSMIFIAACKKSGIASQASGKYRGAMVCRYDPSSSKADTNYATIILVSYVNPNTISINNTTLNLVTSDSFASASSNGVYSTASFGNGYERLIYESPASAYGCTFSGIR